MVFFMYLVGSVTIRAAGGLLQHSQTIAFAVVTLQIGFYRMVIHVVAMHHLFIAVALDAGINVEHPAFDRAGRLDLLDVVQSMTICTAWCIRIPFHEGNTMH